MIERVCRQSTTVNGLRLTCNILVVVFHAAMFPCPVSQNVECRTLSFISDVSWYLSIPVLFGISGWCFFNCFEHITFY